MAAPGGELITLQLGPYASCVGAHWWSLQEVSHRPDSELRCDVLFRRGRGLQGAETFTPRLITVELKGSAQLEGEEEDSAPAWRGRVTTHKEEPPPRSPARLREASDPSGRTSDGGVPSRGGGVCEEQDGAPWAEYLRAPLHPKSHCVLSHRSHGGVSSVESFSQGQALLRAAPHLDELEDRLHFFSEECDYLQGFHLLCDTHNGFSGAGSRVAELLHDEYPGRGILGFGTCPMPPEDQDVGTRIYQLMNNILCLAAMTDHASIFCPMTVRASLGLRPGSPASFPHLLYDARRQYQSAAVLAVAMDTVTAPYRLSSSSLFLSHLTDTLSCSGRKVMTVSCSLPFPLGPASSLPDALLPHMMAPPWRGVSACEDSAPFFSQSVVLRGIPPTCQTSFLPPGTRPLSPLHACAVGAEVLQSYLSALYPGSLSVSHLLGAPCTLGPTFPQFFSSYITKDGRTLAEPSPEPAAVGGVPVMAALRSPASLACSLRSLCDELTRTDLRRWANLSTAGVEEDELREALDDVRSLAQRYKMADTPDSD